MSTLTKTTRFFPDSQAQLIHQTGEQLTESSRGVEITLHSRDKVPFLAELESGPHYATFGLSFDHKDLLDFDGAFELPREIAIMLREAGFNVSADFTD